MSHPVIHSSFTLERTYPTSADRVFDAFANPVRKRRWFAEGEGFIVDSYELDFRVGGFERTRFRFGEDGPPMTYDAVYTDIEDGKKVIFAYWMTIGGQPLSSSLATVELVPDGAGTRLRFTEQVAFTDGRDGTAERRTGTEELHEALARELATHG